MKKVLCIFLLLCMVCSGARAEEKSIIPTRSIERPIKYKMWLIDSNSHNITVTTALTIKGTSGAGSTTDASFCFIPAEEENYYYIYECNTNKYFARKAEITAKQKNATELVDAPSELCKWKIVSSSTSKRFLVSFTLNGTEFFMNFYKGYEENKEGQTMGVYTTGNGDQGSRWAFDLDYASLTDQIFRMQLRPGATSSTNYPFRLVDGPIVRCRESSNANVFAAERLFYFKKSNDGYYTLHCLALGDSKGFYAATSDRNNYGSMSDTPQSFIMKTNSNGRLILEVPDVTNAHIHDLGGTLSIWKDDASATDNGSEFQLTPLTDEDIDGLGITATEEEKALAKSVPSPENVSNLLPMSFDKLVSLCNTGKHFALMAVSSSESTYRKWFGFNSANSQTTTLTKAQLFTLTGSENNYTITRVSDNSTVLSNERLVNRRGDDYAAEYSYKGLHVSFDNTSGQHFNANSYSHAAGTGGWSAYVSYGPFCIAEVEYKIGEKTIAQGSYIVKEGAKITSIPDGYTLADSELPVVTQDGRYEVQVEAFSYRFKYGEEVWYEEYHGGVQIGDEYPNINVVAPYGVSFTRPTGQVASKVADISVTLASNYPVVPTSQYDANGHFYRLQINPDASVRSSSYCYANNNTVLIGTPNGENEFYWQFVGNPFEGYRIYNRSLGISKAIYHSGANGGAPTMTNGGCRWTLLLSNKANRAGDLNQTDNGFFLRPEGANSGGLNRSGSTAATMWTGGADRGSTFHTYEDPEIVSIGSTGAATYFFDSSVTVPENVKVKYLTASDANATEKAEESGIYTMTYNVIESGETVPAGTAVVLTGSPASYRFERFYDENNPIDGNLLFGYAKEKINPNANNEDAGIFALAKPEGYEVGFYRFVGANFKAKKAYLNASALIGDNQQVRGFSIYESEDVVTTILSNMQTNVSAKCYDLTGRVCEGRTKHGIYLSNGKKMMR